MRNIAAGAGAKKSESFRRLPLWAIRLARRAASLCNRPGEYNLKVIVNNSQVRLQVNDKSRTELLMKK